jgi:hypothetical protein
VSSADAVHEKEKQIKMRYQLEKPA